MTQRDGFRMRLRHTEDDNYLDARWDAGVLGVEECVSGNVKVLDGPENVEDVGDEEGVWYDVYVEVNGANVLVRAGKQSPHGVTPNADLTKIVEDTTQVAATTDRTAIIVEGDSEFLFDNLMVVTGTGPANLFNFTYGTGNQLTQFGNAAGLVIDMEYDAWGRTIEAVTNTGGNTYTDAYTYWFGDKTRRVLSDRPGVVLNIGFHIRLWVHKAHHLCRVILIIQSASRRRAPIMRLRPARTPRRSGRLFAG